MEQIAYNRSRLIKKKVLGYYCIREYVPPQNTEYHTADEYDNILDDMVSIIAYHILLFIKKPVVILA